MYKENPYFAVALQLAHLSGERNEVPVGAVIVDKSGNIIGQSTNECEARNDPTAHAEMLAIQQACQTLQNMRLDDCDMYVTLEPCPMCAAAISFARIRRLYFGAYDAKSGGVEHGPRVFQHNTCHWKPEVIGGLKESECAELLQSFFQLKR